MVTNTTKFSVGFLTILLLISGVVYISLDNVQMRVDEDKTTFYIKLLDANNDPYGRWLVSGREYNRLFEGASIQNRDRSTIEVTTAIDEITKDVVITRYTGYQNGASIIDTYVFNGNLDDVEQFPISHKIEVFNAKDLFYRYSLDDLKETGEKRKLTGETLIEFGYRMKVELEPNYRWAWIGYPYGSDSLAAQYNLKSNYEVFNIRFFDPIPITNTSTTVPSGNVSYLTDLQGWCNITDSDNDNIIYEYMWFKNNAHYSNYTLNIGTSQVLNYEDISGTSGTITNPTYFYDGNLSTYMTMTDYEASIKVNISKKYEDMAVNNLTFNLTFQTNGAFSESDLYIDCIGNVADETKAYWQAASYIDGTHTQYRTDETKKTIQINITNSNCTSYYDDRITIRLYQSQPTVSTYVYEIDNIITNIDSVTQGVNTNLNNISNSILNPGDNWTFSCRGYDTYNYSSWLNSSVVNITNVLSITQTSNIETNTSSFCHQDIVDNNNQLEGWCNITNTDDVNITYDYTWFKNDVEFYSRDNSLFANNTITIYNTTYFSKMGGVTIKDDFLYIVSFNNTVFKYSLDGVYNQTYDVGAEFTDFWVGIYWDEIDELFYLTNNYLQTIHTVDENLTGLTQVIDATTCSGYSYSFISGITVYDDEVYLTSPGQNMIFKYGKDDTCLGNYTLTIDSQDINYYNGRFYVGLFDWNQDNPFYIYEYNLDFSEITRNMSFDMQDSTALYGFEYTGTNLYTKEYDEYLYIYDVLDIIDAPGADINLFNLTTDNITMGDEVIFSCRGYDGWSYSSWLNSTEVKIHNISFLIDGDDVRTLTSPITRELSSVILNSTIDAENVLVDSVTNNYGVFLSCDAANDKIFSAENIIRYLFNWSVATDGTPSYDSTFLTFSGAKCPSNAVDYYYDATNTKHYFICSNYDIYTYDATGAYIANYNPARNYRSITGNGTNLFLPDSTSNRIYLTNLTGGDEIALTPANEMCDHVTYAENDDTLWCEDFTNDRLSHYYSNGTRINFQETDITGESIAVCGDKNYLYTTDSSNINYYNVDDIKVCIDNSHTDFGTNYSCDILSTQFDAEVSSFHITTNSDSESIFTLNYTSNENKSFKVQGHQYDEFNNLTLNISGVGDNAKVYVGTTLSNTIGLLSETTTYNQTKFNDTTSAKNVTISTNATLDRMGYFRLPKTAIITSANMTITGIENVTFPFNPWMEIGVLDGTYEWNYTGNFTGNNRDGNWSTAITTYLAACTADSDGFCYVPIYGYSDYKGRLQASVISIIYTYTTKTITLSTSAIQALLTAGSGYTNVTIKVENGQIGNVTISDIDYDYLGGTSDGYTINAHSSDNFCNISSTLKYAYSGWDYTLPSNVNYINWYPWAKDAKNVTPFGQTSAIPMINMTTTNYGSNLDFKIKMYGSADCVTLTVDTDNTKAGGTTMVNDTYITLKTNQTVDSNFGIWLWADLACNYNDWRMWNPSFDLKATATI